MTLDASAQILSDITVYNKYARFSKELGRRETWIEICTRNMDMHIKKYPQLADEIRQVYRDFVFTKKVLPSMRSLQFGGKPIEISPNRIYNCCYLPVDDVHSFSETMFLLLGGTGVGYSVQKKHVNELPPVRKPVRKRRYLIGDSIEGWADSVKALLQAYMSGKSMPVFDFSDIREKGAPLITSGGKAPGPQPLKDCLHNLQKILDSVEDGAQLTPLQVHDMMCYIADAVLAGGIRRAALICLFDLDDQEMLTCKSGAWWELNPQRGRANNSAVVLRHKVTKSDFDQLWEKIKASGSGEPGLYFTNNEDWGCNPCCEIALRPYQFCNLTEINAHDIDSQEEMNARAKAGAFIGTLQAGYTDFHYIRDIWRRTTEKDALIGVSMTGIASGAIESLDESQAAAIVLEENARVSKLIGISAAARSTCIKPAGTTSCVLGSSSGIHAWHDEYYIRNMRLGKNESLYLHLAIHHPELVQDEFFKPQSMAVLSLPMRAPSGAVLRHETALELLERIKRYTSKWVRPGHRRGDNTHNVSATVSIREGEWDEVREWMWTNRAEYSGLSVLPYDGGSYVQAPFETCTKEKYEEMMKLVSAVDLTKVVEIGDNTDLKGEAACAGGACEIV
jgi:ribonucleoside-triphosphate reductase (thioredoxin)